MRRVVAVTLLVAGCSGGARQLPPPPSNPSAPDSAASAFCDQLVGMSRQLATVLGSSQTDFAALARLYAQLEPSAPAAIKPTVTDVVAALEETSDPSKLADFATRAATDTQALSAYTRTNC